MYDHESADLSRLLYFWTMPRVVEDQRQKFQSDQFFINLSRPTEVKYTKLPHAPEAERRDQFVHDCREGHIPISFVPSGFNLDLTVPPGQRGWPSTSTLASPHPSTSTVDYLEMPSNDSAEVRLCSRLILNGVCVTWRGWIDRNSLRGQGCLEFDDSRAEEENRRLRSEMQLLGERFRQLEQQFLPASAISQNHRLTDEAGSSHVVTTTHASPSL